MRGCGWGVRGCGACWCGCQQRGWVGAGAREWVWVWDVGAGVGEAWAYRTVGMGGCGWMGGCGCVGGSDN